MKIINIMRYALLIMILVWIAGCTPDSSAQTQRPTVVLLLDTNGHSHDGKDLLTGVLRDSINFVAAGLHPTLAARTMHVVREDFSTFNLAITFDEAEYLAAPIGARIRCLITPWTPLFPSGMSGLAIARLPDTVDMHCVVLWDKLLGGIDDIGSAVSHEVGHVLGLLHQSLYVQGGKKLYEYNPGNYYWSPIMGVPHRIGMTTWNIGTAEYADLAVDEISHLGRVLGWKPDDLGDTFSEAKKIDKGRHIFLMNNCDDVDYFYIPGNLTHLKFSGFGNCLMKISVYNSNNKWLFTTKEYNIHLKPGTGYFVRIETIGNPFVMREVLMGQYAVDIN